MGEGSSRGWVFIGEDQNKDGHVTKGEVTVSSSEQVIGPGDVGTPQGL